MLYDSVRSVLLASHYAEWMCVFNHGDGGGQRIQRRSQKTSTQKPPYILHRPAASFPGIQTCGREKKKQKRKKEKWPCSTQLTSCNDSASRRHEFSVLLRRTVTPRAKKHMEETTSCTWGKPLPVGARSPAGPAVSSRALGGPITRRVAGILSGRFFHGYRMFTAVR